jgi:hypothetical protein
MSHHLLPDRLSQTDHWLENMFRRVAAGILGALNISIGLTMLIAGHRWFMTTPGVVATGPYNPHFVADVGAAFLAAGLALLVRSWRFRFWPAAAAGSTFLVFHGLIHVRDFFLHPHDLGSTLSVVVSSFLAMWAALPSKGDTDAQRHRPQSDQAHGRPL